jgi:hypothetical protein
VASPSNEWVIDEQMKIGSEQAREVVQLMFPDMVSLQGEALLRSALRLSIPLYALKFYVE